MATRLAEGGASASEIHHLLDHESLATSQLYIDTTTNEQRAAARANRTYRVLEGDSGGVKVDGPRTAVVKVECKPSRALPGPGSSVPFPSLVARPSPSARTCPAATRSALARRFSSLTVSLSWATINEDLPASTSAFQAS